MQNISPWLHNLKSERESAQLRGSVYTEVCVLGGGISGMFTAFCILWNTNKRVVLIEGDKIAHGATGHNAGYVVADFEKPFADIVKEFGLNIAREGLKEFEDAWHDYVTISERIGTPKPEMRESIVAFSSKEHFLETLHEEYLKYGMLKTKVFVVENSGWISSIPEFAKDNLQVLNDSEFKEKLDSKSIDTTSYQAITTQDLAIANSARFTENLANYCLRKFRDRFAIYENSFVKYIRLEQSGNIVLDSTYGVCMAQELVLCTNGFENFEIFGPYNRTLNQKFHHMVSGLIGYMIGTFRLGKESRDGGGVFYEEKYSRHNMPFDAGPYLYYTRRHFDMGVGDGELFCIGGPEVKLSDRRVYRKDHEMDQRVYKELCDFQKDTFNISEEPVFKWHGLMGYTSTGVRIIGRDSQFHNLYYNLGCNGIGIIPAVAGGKRIAKLIKGERLPKSIFDPK